MKNVNVLVAGVGGQGVILSSDALTEICLNNGYDVKKSDSLGMAQRGGGVVSHVRMGTHVFSPLIKKGDVDLLVGFEQLEAARWAAYLRPNGVAIVSDVVIIPMSVIGSTTPYPSWDEIKGILSQYAREIYLIPATKIGLEVGNPRALNMVMLGSLSVFLELKVEAWTEDIRRRLPPDFVESSLEAFYRGASDTKAMRLATTASGA
jgi:indolepyruvate ferredoxin oxidoreductase beta subunit